MRSISTALKIHEKRRAYYFQNSNLFDGIVWFVAARQEINIDVWQHCAQTLKKLWSGAVQRWSRDPLAMHLNGAMGSGMDISTSQASQNRWRALTSAPRCRAYGIQAQTGANIVCDQHQWLRSARAAAQAMAQYRHRHFDRRTTTPPARSIANFERKLKWNCLPSQ